MQQAAAKNIRAFKIKCLDVHFDLDNSEYKAVQNIGTGAYGVVCAAVHKKTSEKVAIKKIPNAFEELTTAKRTYRELKIMRHFRHENVIGIREILMPREPLNDFKDVYVVLDLMESDLHHIIHSQQSVTMEHIRYFLYQILRGLKYIHSANVVHRDLKPSNLLVNENCELKIGDFGMARGLSGNTDAKRKMFMTVYVATRWYRAPELLFSNDDYSHAVDMWSVGCIFAEMLGRRQIFPGKNPMHQLTLIIEVLGMPPDSLLRSTNSDQIFNFFHRNFGGKQSISLKDKYPKLDDDGMDLLSKMLVFNPEERISVNESLSHPFLGKYHDPDDEPNCFPAFDFAFEQDDLTKQQIRQNVGKMILKYERTKLLAGKKFPGSFAIVKPSTAAVTTTTAAPVSFACAPETKSAISQSGPTSAILTKVLPKKNTDVGKNNLSTCTDIKPDRKEGIFKVPSLPVEEKKLLPSESKSTKKSGAEEEILSVKAVSMLSVANDVDMRSAPSSAQNSAIANKEGFSVDNNTSSLVNLTVSSNNTNLGDVEMKSARGEQKQTFTQSSFGPSDESTSELQDIDMQSARQQEEGAGCVEGCSSQIKETLSNTGKQLACSECTGQKTISDDTKKLIKAVLLQSALKNKIRKDSEAEKGGGKMPVTALTRQRERELKRRQKLHRSRERQNKCKGKGRRSIQAKEEDVHQLLTDEDRNMLERWNKMQSKKQEPSGDGTKVPATEDSAAQSVHEKGTLTHKHTGTDIAVTTAADSIPNAQQSSSNSSLNERGDPLSLETNAVSHLHQKQEVAIIVKPPFNKELATTTAIPQQQSTHVVSSFSSPLSSTLFPFLVSPQSQQNTYSGTNKTPPRTGSSLENFGMSNSPLYVSPPTSQALSVYSNSAFYPESAGNMNNMAVRSKHQPQVTVPNNTAGKSNISPSTSATAQLRSRCSPGVSPPDKADRGSDFQQYRSRHYSDRETPSPPHNVQQSPPGYEDAMKAKLATSCTNPSENHESYPYKQSIQYLSPNRRSPMARGAFGLQPHTRSAPSPPELAQVIHQLSKSAMEDVLPPTLQVTPKGDGAGYGLSLDLEDWLDGSFGSPSGASKLDSGPLSASLLSDWLEVRYMNTDDMIAVQEELGLTSPFNLSDIPGLVESPKNKDRD